MLLWGDKKDGFAGYVERDARDLRREIVCCVLLTGSRSETDMVGGKLQPVNEVVEDLHRLLLASGENQRQIAPRASNEEWHPK
jgi:hypothetical protein